jgi:hypothetical protein
MFAVDDVQIESIQLGEISLGKKRIHKKAIGEIHNFSRQSAYKKNVLGRNSQTRIWRQE